MIHKTNEDNVLHVLHYTFTSQILIGFIILFFIYLFLAVPISMSIDLRIKKYGKFLHFLLDFFAGIIVGLLFLMIDPTSNHMAGFRLTLLFAWAGGLFSIVLSVFQF